MTIEIVSDLEIRGGRYCFKGTRMPVAPVKEMVDATGREWVLNNYTHIPLTDEHIDAAIAFDYLPLFEEPELEVHHIDLRCVCGEYLNEPTVNRLRRRCGACGRTWEIDVTVSEAKP